MAESFDQAKQRAEPFTLLGGDRLRILWDTAQQCAGLEGSMAEVGVYRGGSARLLRAAAEGKALFLFDTFAGHPAVAHADEGSHHAGRFSDTSAEAVMALFVDDCAPPALIEGRFPDSIRAFGDRWVLPWPLCFVHCDVDLYESTRDVLAELWPHLVVGGALVCDDYGFDDCAGAKRAVEEFVRDRTDVRIERLPTLQARLWKAA